MLRFKAARRQSPALKPQGELTASERRVIRLMDAAMQQLRNDVDRTMMRLADAVAHRSVNHVINMIPVDPWLDAQVGLQQELYGELLDAGSRVKLPAIQKATLAFSFDRSRPESAAWAQSQAGSLIVEVMDGQRTMVRDIVSQAQASGLSPTEVARQIRNGIGLTTTQAGWVDNFYNRTLAANISGGMSMTDATRRAQSATDRYQKQIHRYRATTIARTEIMRANSEGRQQAWNQGLAGGWISPTAKKEWIAEADACEICAPFNGTRIGIKEQFAIGEPPAHPNCRCDVLLVDEIPKDIQQMTDAELDAELERLLSPQPAPVTQDPFPQSLRDSLGTRNFTPEDVQTRFAQAKTGKQAYIDDYQAQVRDWEDLVDQDMRDPLDAAMAWGSDDYRTINRALSGDGSMSDELRQSRMTVSEFVDKMDEAFNMSPNRYDDIVVQRTTSSQYQSIRELIEAEPGAVFQSDGYMATTMQSLDQIRLGGISGDVDFEILVPKYSRALNVDAVTYSGTREYEILLDKGASFIVLDKPTRTEAGRWLVRLLLIG